MGIKNQPCAYCGTRHIPRTRGHVIPKSMYPPDSKAQRLTAPECDRCKESWKDSDDRFRILISMCTETPETVFQFKKAVVDAINNHDDVPRLQWIVDHMIETTHEGRQRSQLFPERSAEVMQVLERIARGLLYVLEYPIVVHKTEIEVQRFPYALPDILDSKLDERLERRFFRFQIFPMSLETEPDYIMLLEFYENVRFVCIVKRVDH